VRTGILGGTFDPIHIAHLHAGECALAQAELDRVLFIPAGSPWQKQGAPMSPGHHRFEMVRLALDGVDGLEADPREVVRDGPTYTVDTIASFPDDEELFLILGADAALRLPTWHRVDEVLERVTVLVVPRPGTSLADAESVVPEFRVLDMGVLDVSATTIRRLAAAGEPFRFLVTAPVFDYIVENDLYTEQWKGDIVQGQPEMEEPS
jgi:nicotinate-nucleotide adenylyltransferase